MREGNFETRIILFDAVVRDFILYETEISGWERQKVSQIIETKYTKWALGINNNTQTYTR